jgi:CheY-like chemotaxis protein
VLTSFSLVLVLALAGLVSILVTRNLDVLATAPSGTFDPERLKRALLGACLAGAALGFVIQLVFVRLYVGPLVRATETAFRKLERRTTAASGTPQQKSELATTSNDRALGLPLRTLVVDNNLANLAALDGLLTSWGMQVNCATSGDDALDLARAALRDKKPFELAIIDYRMPRMHGRELARRLRVELGLHALPIVMLATRGPWGVAGTEQHIDETLTKPVRRGELRRALELALGRHRARSSDRASKHLTHRQNWHERRYRAGTVGRASSPPVKRPPIRLDWWVFLSSSAVRWSGSLPAPRRSRRSRARTTP